VPASGADSHASLEGVLPFDGSRDGVGVGGGRRLGLLAGHWHALRLRVGVGLHLRQLALLDLLWLIADLSADFRAAVSTLWSGEVEAEPAVSPPGDGGVGGQVGAAQDG
jgi:hypothetical protein